MNGLKLIIIHHGVRTLALISRNPLVLGLEEQSS